MEPMNSENFFLDQALSYPVIPYDFYSTRRNPPYATPVPSSDSHFVAKDVNPGISRTILGSGSRTRFLGSSSVPHYYDGLPSASSSYLPIIDYNQSLNSILNLPSSYNSLNNARILSSSVADPLSFSQWITETPQGWSSQRKRQLEQMDASILCSQTLLLDQYGSDPLPKKSRVSQAQKKSRSNSRQENLALQYMVQQLLQSEQVKNSQNHNPMLETLAQQYKISQLLLPDNCEHTGQHAINVPVPVPAAAPIDGICARTLLYYLGHLRCRPQGNDIGFWRKFVNEYFAQGAKKRWCLSSYKNIGSHAYGLFSQGSPDSQQCDLCGSKSGKGLEATFEIFPRLFKLRFENNVIDELLYLDIPMETKLPRGYMMLQYDKAVLKSVYESCHIVHEGKLRIVFTQDLKIISWLFCAQKHEEFVQHRLIAPQVNQLVEAAEKYQKNIPHISRQGELSHARHINTDELRTVGRQLVRTLEFQSMSEVGFSKDFVRQLQVFEVFNCLKDLMTDSLNNNIGPIESLNRYCIKEVTIDEPKGSSEGLAAPHQRTKSEGLSANRRVRSMELANDYHRFLLDVGHSTSAIPSKLDFHNFPSANYNIQARKEGPIETMFEQKPRPQMKHPSSVSSFMCTAVAPVTPLTSTIPIHGSMKTAQTERRLWDTIINDAQVEQMVSGGGNGGSGKGDYGCRPVVGGGSRGGHGMIRSNSLPMRGHKSSSSTTTRRAQPMSRKAKGTTAVKKEADDGLDGVNAATSIPQVTVKKEPLYH